MYLAMHFILHINHSEIYMTPFMYYGMNSFAVSQYF